MKNLVIVGARGYGREICAMTPFSRGFGSEFKVKGFLDSKSDALDAFSDYPPILSSPEDYEPCSSDVFICALGDVKWRKHYADMITSKGGKFISLVHVNASLGQNVSVGDGCFIRNNVTLSADISIGSHSSIFDFSVVGHDCVIGDYCHINVHSFLGGGVKLCNLVTVHPAVHIVPHKTIGEGATVGATSLVIRNVKPGTTVFGVPAMPLDFEQT